MQVVIGMDTKQIEALIRQACQEAQAMNYGYLGTEHILLAIANDEKSKAAEILVHCGIKLSAVRPVVEFMLGRGKEPHRGPITLTSLAGQPL